MKQTGERPIRDSTPAALVALHDAGYRELVHNVSGSHVLDIGCGVGDETARLRSPNRTVFGIDYHQPTALLARTNGVSSVCGDGACLPVASGLIDTVCSSHIIEHFVDPEPHVREIARVLTNDGRALVLTPNEPADFENPFHVHLFTEQSLRSLLERHFREVKIVGLDGDSLVKADFEARRRTGTRLLRLDPLNLRKRLPRSLYVKLHAVGRRVLYPLTNRLQKSSTAISESNFHTTGQIDSSTLVLFAVASGPRRT